MVAHTVKLVQGVGDVLYTSIAGHRDREGSLENDKCISKHCQSDRSKSDTNLEWLNHSGGVDPLPATAEVKVYSIRQKE